MQSKTNPLPGACRGRLDPVDVLVAGGGPAGLAAALSAARQGASVLLVERFGYLGGMMTGAHVVAVLGMGDGTETGPRAGGICAELRERLRPLGGIASESPRGDYRVDAELLKWQAMEMLIEAGARVLNHALACDPIVEDRTVKGVYLETKRGRLAAPATVVVDATADGDVAFRGGCAFDNETHDVTLGLRVEGIDAQRVADFENRDAQKARRVMDAARALNNGKLPGEGWHLKDIDVTDPAALTEAELRFRRDCFKALMYLRKNMPGYENARVVDSWPQIGVRQSRRIRCEATLTDEDLRASRHFSDGIARLGSYLLGYKLYAAGALNYDIPLRCMLPVDMDGLIVAGRCVSADYLAANSLRLIVPCLATGQAAGVAAALAVQGSAAVRNVDVAALRKALAAQGVRVDG